MFKLIPRYGSRLEQMVPSGAERKVYHALAERLGGDFTVFHSVSWIAPNRDGAAQDGECDFLIAHPSLGIVAIEVKGGGVSYEPHSRIWTSRDKDGASHNIKDPFQQARNAKHQISAVLREQKEWQRIVPGKIALGHAVWFPDLADVGGISGPDRPGDIILSAADVADPNRALARVFQYWQAPSLIQLSRAGVDTVERVFARRFEVRPTASSRLAEEEQARVELTNAQFRLLRLLGSRRRVGIAGGAGTGKTLLAIEKAHELARGGHRTLLLSYNSALGDHLSAIVDSALPIWAGNFHSFCTELFRRYGQQYLARARRDFPDSNQWDVHFPAALCYLLEEHEEKYDAIVIDEAQDFAEEFWFPIECLMSDAATSPLYLFYDTNQQIYRRTAKFPIRPEEEFILTENCRNTGHIHALVSRYYAGPPMVPPPIVGTPIGRLPAETMRAQARLIGEQIRNLLLNERIPAREIVVLIADRLSFQSFVDELKSETLPTKAEFTDFSLPQTNRVRIMTAAKFKGMEAAFVFVWGIDLISADTKRSELYVALSRAKHQLYVVGTEQSIADVMNHVASVP